MRKPLLFLTVFLFFTSLGAEEVQVGEYEMEDFTITLFAEKEPEPEPEKGQETEPDTEGKECCCDVSRETSIEKPKFFYFQPAVGFGTGLSLYRPTVSLVADFLVKKEPKINYYVGLDVEARAGFVEFEAKELAVQANVVFDFIQKCVPKLRSAGLWIAYGIDLMFVRHREEEYWDDFLTFEYFQAWGFGVDLFFTNNMIMRFGLDGFMGSYPDVTILVGYRF